MKAPERATLSPGERAVNSRGGLFIRGLPQTPFFGVCDLRTDTSEASTPRGLLNRRTLLCASNIPMAAGSESV